MRIPLFCTLALCLGLPVHAEQGDGVAGRYYYPQPYYYGGYAPYGYQGPAYPGAGAPMRSAAPRPAPAPAPAPAAESGPSDSGSAAVEIDGRYPLLAESVMASAPEVFGRGRSRLGPVLASAAGRTLYVAMDEAGEGEDCSGQCPGWWRPFLAAASDAPTDVFGIRERGDGSRQWSYGDSPLYLWFGDAGDGDVTGDGVDGNWYAVRIVSDERFARASTDSQRKTNE